jgi:hypothetical protein
MFNTVQTFQGAANAIGGAIRTARLDFLSDTMRDRRRDLEDAKKEADDILKIVKASRDAGMIDFNGVVETLEKQAKVDYATERALTAQARLDRAQNQAALWQVGTGVANFAQGMGYGYLPQYAPQAPAQVPVQVGAAAAPQQVMAPVAYLPGGFAGGMLVPAAAGFAGGAMAGALLDGDRDRRRRE